MPDGTIDSSDMCSQAVVERVLGDDSVTSIKIFANLESDNYDGGVVAVNPGSVGWRIERNTGDAAFNNVTVRGDLISADGSGNVITIDSGDWGGLTSQITFNSASTVWDAEIRYTGATDIFTIETGLSGGYIELFNQDEITFPGGFRLVGHDNGIINGDVHLVLGVLDIDEEVWVGDGTAGAPSYTFGNDTITGMFRAAADTIGFTAGGTERVRIDSDELRLQSGQVGLTFGGTGTAEIKNSAASIRMTTSSTERVRVESNGVFIRNAGLGVGLLTALTSGYIYNVPPTTGTAANATWMLASGSIYYLNRDTSSRRYKRDIKAWDDTAWIYDLQHVQYTGSSAEPLHDGTGEPLRDDAGEMRYERTWNDHSSYGLIAEDTHAVNPAAAALDADGKPDSIMWNVITAAIPNELRKLRDRIELLEAM